MTTLHSFIPVENIKPQEIIITKTNSSKIIAVITTALHDNVLQGGSLLNTSAHYPVGINPVLLNQAQREDEFW